MVIEDIEEFMPVQDTWFSFKSDYNAWGAGVVTKVLKTRVHVDFRHQGKVVYDKAHLQFLVPYHE